MTEKFKSLFPKKAQIHCMPKRYQEKFVINNTWTERIHILQAFRCLGILTIGRRHVLKKLTIYDPPYDFMRILFKRLRQSQNLIYLNIKLQMQTYF